MTSGYIAVLFISIGCPSWRQTLYMVAGGITRFLYAPLRVGGSRQRVAVYLSNEQTKVISFLFGELGIAAQNQERVIDNLVYKPQ